MRNTPKASIEKNPDAELSYTKHKFACKTIRKQCGSRVKCLSLICTDTLSRSTLGWCCIFPLLWCLNRSLINCCFSLLKFLITESSTVPRIILFFLYCFPYSLSHPGLINPCQRYLCFCTEFQLSYFFCWYSPINWNHQPSLLSLMFFLSSRFYSRVIFLSFSALISSMPNYDALQSRVSVY